MLGERIRKIRKQKKMTLEALAGEELTKGMLSLIENNKAKPSMESLAYIAKQLQVEISELLDEVSTLELRAILEQAEKLFNSEDVNGSEKYQPLIALIEPYIEKLTQGYEAARLLDIYARCLYREKISGWDHYFDRAAKMYDEMNLTAKRASVGIFRALVKFIEHDYQSSLTILLHERTELEKNHAYIDPITRLDLDYHEAVLHFAVGDSESATRVMEGAIHFSKEHRIFYRIDDLYRLAAAQAEMVPDDTKKEHYIMKLKQYGEFADDLQTKLFYQLFQVMALIGDKHDYHKALEIIDQIFAHPKMEELFEDWFLIEKGKALYGLGQYSDALACFEKVEIPEYAHHPFDLSLFYVLDSYKARCHFELGNREESEKWAKTAVENFESLLPTPHKDFAMDTYKKITEN
ncbi:helix-turn-helix domain-containing protein [Neobacillus niacini]|uniref:helix-turn-helix domain-containing protein n=1 Tax=Neobacillus niacini TaxID=86668 RepID=UPI0021CB0A7E|nr:helix-turn-helix transcriptional regulator [Neobacillus niacini]MCM3766795.1 helix-turn-helix domain-containing protein [Neobacillus niacini]